MCDLKKCENCDNDHNGDYGSGRFCSSKCARGFSTKNKRSLINKKVSKSLTKDPYNIVCEICKKIFHSKRKTAIMCSIKCKSIKGGTTIKKDTSKMGGMRDGGGRSKMLIYINHLGEKMKLNKEEIEIAKILDNLKLTWNRNIKGFEYYDELNKQRKFYPDFYILEYNIFIEYKGWVIDKMIHKMNDSLKRNNFKLLIIYGKDKRFSNLGLNINDLNNNNKLLEKYMKIK